ncbi:hypothetical protein D0Y65_014600 [Glycine soja]|uniref:Uncharacterized protein n=1 Tax=Glycine soja TaxID=3848 RepID=A0A445K964_GLYSO|nr:hypothetical protein D0Y65_014600 [Glycine soja]
MGCVIGVRLASFFTGAAAASFLGLYSLHNDYKLAHLYYIQRVRRQNLEGRDFGWPSCYSSSPFLTSELYKGLKSFPLPTKQNVNDEWPPQITGKSNFFLGKTETNGNF